MADRGTGDKTEKASPQKLRKAREQGQVARSRDIAAAIGTVVSLKVLTLLAPSWLGEFRAIFALCLADLSGVGGIANAWSILFPAAFTLLAKMLLPLFIVPLCIAAGSIFPGGWVLTFSQFQPKFSRLNPLANLGRLVSGKHYAQLGISIAKAVALGVTLYFVVRSSLPEFVHLQSVPLLRAIAGSAGLLLDAALTLTAVVVTFALVDMPVQYFLFMKSQRMTKQEVKEEYKTSEGRPEVRNRIRQLQRQLSQRSIAKAVPQADVVIANPTHYSVALKYDAKRADAPYVLAKGVDEMALYIRELAKEHGVAVLVLPPLARAIYNTSQVNQQIPASLYRAVAQVLTYVMQLKAFQAGRRRARPVQPSGLGLPDDFLSPPKR
ncbi:flagellar type III secretion system protein FlhB [Trinickia mobilis]|uniref:flagellar type III secretion system protein FlhB n=1 Tax=Trinickia mobilis TaxID=2816356 RepID=UPI001A8E77B4|nr:flagellar type III secretion system protein FlhB [Trinickia mobilis]